VFLLPTLEENKKAFVPTRDKSLYNFCGTTQIDEMNHPLILRTNMRTPLITDGASVGVYFRSNRFQAALTRPFTQTCAAALPPPAALWIHPNLATFLVPRVCSVILICIICTRNDIVKQVEEYIIFVHRKNGSALWINLIPLCEGLRCQRHKFGV
jgi:hypothetical protein